MYVPMCGKHKNYSIALVFLWLMSAASSGYRYTPLELEILVQGKADYSAHQAETYKRQRVLCFVILATKVKDVRILYSNAEVLPCDWAISFYNIRNLTLQNEICNVQTLSPHRVIHCQPSSIKIKDIHKIAVGNVTFKSPQGISYLLRPSHNLSSLIPKQTIYPDILPYTRNYSKILMFDADISFTAFNFTKGMEIWDCAYPLRPLVVQPTIRGYTDYAFLSERYYRRNKKLLGVATNVIEIMTPFLDSLYFDWLVRHVMAHTRYFHALYGSDWGIDYLWCPLAYHYATYVLGYSADNYTSACGILVGAGPAVHLNGKVIQKGWAFEVFGEKMGRLYTELFPTFSSYGKGADGRPLLPTATLVADTRAVLQEVYTVKHCAPA